MNTLKNILAALAVLAAGVLVGWCSRGRFAPDINVVTKTDTLILRDTNIYFAPPPIFSDIDIDDRIEVAPSDIIIKTDSLVVLPVEVKRYKGDDYEVQVSGYNPKIDWVNVFPETKYITKTMTDNRRNSLYLSGEMTYSNRFATSALLTYEYRWKFISLGIGAGYEFVGNKPVLMAKVTIPVFKW